MCGGSRDNVHGITNTSLTRVCGGSRDNVHGITNASLTRVCGGSRDNVHGLKVLSYSLCARILCNVVFES